MAYAKTRAAAKLRAMIRVVVVAAILFVDALDRWIMAGAPNN